MVMRVGSSPLDRPVNEVSRLTPQFRVFVWSIIITMPVQARTEVEIKELYASVRPKLTFILEERKVPQEVIAQIASLDIVTVNQFARTGRNDDDFTQWLEEDVKVNKADPGGRSLQARLFDAYDLCKRMKDEEDSASARSSAINQPLEIPRGDHLELRRTYQSITGQIRDELYPSYAYFNARMQELEDNELCAEPLDAVTNRRYEIQQGSDDYTIQWSKRGEAMMKRSKLRGILPKSTEEYRAIYTIMGHHWGLVRLKHSNRPYLQGLDTAFWSQHVEHMLGEEVRGLSVRNSSGAIAASTSWHTFIVYDQELRNKAFKLVNENGRTIREAMVEARNDNELRTKFLVTPLALSHLDAPQHATGTVRARQDTDWGNDNESEAKWQKKQKGAKGKQGGKGKGKGKGKSKDKGKPKEKSRLQALRAAGRLKFGAEGSCWDFNRQGGCSKGSNCEFNHTCCNCGGRHSVEDCDSYAAVMGAN